MASGKNLITPNIYIEEVTQYPTVIQPVSTSIPIFYGVAQWGPVGAPTRIVGNFTKYLSTFGTYEAGELLAYEVENFFNEGGSECYVVRLAHYTDETVEDNIAATKASLNLQSADDGYAPTVTPAFTTIEVNAKHYGLLGNRLSVTVDSDPIRSSRGEGSDLSAQAASGATYIDVVSLYGYEEGMILRLYDSAAGGTVAYHIIDRTETVGTATYRIHLDTALTHTFPVATTMVHSLEFTIDVYLDGILVENKWRQMNLNTAADNYCETVVNDEYSGSNYISLDVQTSLNNYGDRMPAEVLSPTLLTGATDEKTGLDDSDKVGSLAGKSGLYAAHSLRNKASLACVPGCSQYVIRLATNYFKARQDIFFVAGVPESDTSFTSGSDDMSAITTPALAVTWREKTSLDTDYGAVYYPWVYVNDPISVATNPIVKIDPVGSVLGVYSRVDSKHGVWEAPAGEGADFGKLNYVLDVAYDIIIDDTEYGILNQAGINSIIPSPNGGYEVGGARTLTVSEKAKWLYVPVRRLFIMLEQSVITGTRFALFRGNKESMWRVEKRAVLNMLENIRRSGGLVGAPEDAYFVRLGLEDGTMTQADIEDPDGSREIGEFGAAPVRPKEFITWKVSQIGSTFTVSE